jgi:tRNA U34 5-carboxymethylaminomethyl modifying GTPase MnmE/TrmE
MDDRNSENSSFDENDSINSEIQNNFIFFNQPSEKSLKRRLKKLRKKTAKLWTDINSKIDFADDEIGEDFVM